MNNFYNKDIYSLKDFSREDLEFLFQVADKMKAVREGGGRIDLLSTKSWPPCSSRRALALASVLNPPCFDSEEESPVLLTPR